MSCPNCGRYEECECTWMEILRALQKAGRCRAFRRPDLRHIRRRIRARALRRTAADVAEDGE